MIRFIGYQEGYGNYPPFALFDILIPNHPNYLSTVSIPTLVKLGLEIPEHPNYIEYKKVKAKEK